MATALRTSGSSSGSLRRPGFRADRRDLRIHALVALRARQQSVQVVQRVVERLARQQTPVEHHFAILRDDVVPDPACDTGHREARVADQRMVNPPQFAIARIEQGHELARGEDRIHAELRAA